MAPILPQVLAGPLLPLSRHSSSSTECFILLTKVREHLARSEMWLRHPQKAIRCHLHQRSCLSNSTHIHITNSKCPSSRHLLRKEVGQERKREGRMGVVTDRYKNGTMRQEHAQMRTLLLHAAATAIPLKHRCVLVARLLRLQNGEEARWVRGRCVMPVDWSTRRLSNAGCETKFPVGQSVTVAKTTMTEKIPHSKARPRRTVKGAILIMGTENVESSGHEPGETFHLISLHVFVI